MLLSVRAALFISAFIGCLYSLCAIFTTGPHDTGIGMAVAAASIVGWGLIDWIEKQ